jgi:hypothetical protein
MNSFRAVCLGRQKRLGFSLLVEVLHPRKGVASQYVEGRFANNDDVVCFDILRDNGATVTFSIPNVEGKTFSPFPLATS